MKARRITIDVIIYVILAAMAVIWLSPIVWLVLQSFSAEGGMGSAARFLPNEWGFQNYIGIFTNTYWDGNNYVDTNGQFAFFFYSNPYTGQAILGSFVNTLIVALCTMVISTFLTLSTAYALSRLRFKGRQLFMRMVLLMGMFPGFLGLIILYWIFRLINFQPSIWTLVICYSAGSGAGYYISKGFFDTISKQIDEAAMIDGANRFQIFYKITIPLSKPIIVYQALTSFMGPWGDFITAAFMLGDSRESYTVAVQLQKMLIRENISQYYGTFCAAAVLIAIPITVLFIFMQKYYVSGVTGGSVKG